MSTAVYIGRFQPFHRGHLHVIEEALKDARISKLIVVVGSTNKAITSKNPYTYEQRKAMIEACVDTTKVTVKPSRDYMYPELEKETLWNDHIRELIGSDCKYIVGYEKDNSSYYLKNFPELEYIGVSGYETSTNYWGVNGVKYLGGSVLSATNLREDIYENGNPYKASSDLYYLCEETLLNLTNEYNELKEEFTLFKDYPYKASLNCCCSDNVVINKGKILLIKRNGLIGHGLLALAGGHKDSNETHLQASLRELSEETNINLSEEVLASKLKGSMSFDHPQRNLGVTKPTQAFLFDLTSVDETITVAPKDDALEVMWVDLEELPTMETLFHDDHYDIIQEMLKNFK